MERLSEAEFGSDYAVDVLRALGVPYVACNPGASFRGLHDSLVNYAGGGPEIVFCTHEEISVSIAHGYAKAAGRPMAAAVHDVVGLQHAAMAIFNAWCDRAPVLVLGGTGPMAVETRRPWIDWIHTALVQGNQVRDYVKWDDQPATLRSVADSLPRAYRLAVTDPAGPVYVCFDAWLQESPAEDVPPIPDVDRLHAGSPPAPNPEALSQLADWLAAAEHPVVLADYVGRSPEAFEALVGLAEDAGLPVIDCGGRLNFPSDHPLNHSFAAADVLAEADLVVGLDMRDLFGRLVRIDRIKRTTVPLIRPGTRIVRVGLEDYRTRSWASDYQRLPEVDLPILADTAVALPQLRAALRGRLDAGRCAARRSALEARGRQLREKGLADAAGSADERPLSQAHVAHALRQAVGDLPFVFANGDLEGWIHRVFPLREPRQHLGTSGGGGLGYGLGASVGAALALKNSGKLVIDLQSDGDMMFVPGALWTAAHHGIPLLAIVVDNRSYYNSEEHQFTMARHRSRDEKRAHIGTRIENPTIDYGALARSLGVWGEGSVETPEALAEVLPRAIDVVVRQRKPALISVVVQPR